MAYTYADTAVINLLAALAMPEIGDHATREPLVEMLRHVTPRARRVPDMLPLVAAAEAVVEAWDAPGWATWPRALMEAGLNVKTVLVARAALALTAIEKGRA
jgi:hypothetical protein